MYLRKKNAVQNVNLIMFEKMVQLGGQNYECKNCIRKFILKNQSWVEQVYDYSTEHKQTYLELEDKYHRDENTIRKYFDQLGAESRFTDFKDVNEPTNL